MYRIEFIYGQRPSNADPDGLPWEPVHLEPWVDPYDLKAMTTELESREMSADGGFTYRMVEVEPQLVDRYVGAELKWVTVKSYRRLREVA